MFQAQFSTNGAVSQAGSDNNMKSENSFSQGLKDGIPICLGYISVAFAFGIFAVGSGLSGFEAVLISLTNVTSAGQLAAVPIMCSGGTLIELAVTQLVINLRYALMSVSLSQKLGSNVRLFDRFIISFVNTDEVFAVSTLKDFNVSRNYMYGLILMPYLGWAFGTLLGVIAGAVLPTIVISALGIAIYGMFIAIVIPPAKKDKKVLFSVLFAIALSCAFRYVPFLSSVSAGFVIIICAVTASALFALICPLKEDDKNA